MLSRHGGFLAPTPVQRHPLARLISALLLQMMPILMAYAEQRMHQHRAGRAEEAQATQSMLRPMTVAEAFEVLSVDPALPGAAVVPLALGSEARATADRNVQKFFAMCQDGAGQSAADTASSSAGATAPPASGSASTSPLQADYLAGKFSGAYRVLVDPDWDKPQR